MLGDDAAIWSVSRTRTTSTLPSSSPASARTTTTSAPARPARWCRARDAAYFVRDPQLAGDPAQLLRWDGPPGRRLRGPPGQSFLEAPRCGDAALVVTALSEGGDEQVMAALS